MEQPTQMNRRDFLWGSTALAIGLSTSLGKKHRVEKKMGVASPSYALRFYRKMNSEEHPAFENAIDLLKHCHKLGAGGIQVGVRNWDKLFAGKMRDLRESLGLYLEGQIGLPKKESEISRFESEVINAKEAGATILRTVCLSGRRYENFKTLEEFQTFRNHSYQSLAWAEPVVRKHQVMLAVENHKDWRIKEFHDILKHFDSEWIRVNLDTGNNISLLEDPMEVVEALAPYTVTIHYKDMAYQEYEDGFLLSEVPLGKGNLDLLKMKTLCEQHYPAVNFNLEMITRDPLKIPCLKKDYWTTFEQVSPVELASMLREIRHHQHHEGLPALKGKTEAEQLALEEENVQLSFDYAKGELGFA